MMPAASPKIATVLEHAVWLELRVDVPLLDLYEPVGPLDQLVAWGFLVLYVLGLGLVCRAGVKRVETRTVAAIATAVSIVAAVWIAGWREPEVEATRVIRGVLLGSVLYGFVPLFAYYGLGRALSNRRILLVVCLLASLPLLAYYMILVGLWTAGVVACTPDQYECPI